VRRIHLNHIKLRDKLLLMYIFSVFIPIVLTNVVFYNVTTTNIRNQKTRDATLAMDSIRGDIQSVIDQAVGISYMFYADPDFNEILSRRFQSTFDYVEAYNSYLKGTFSKYNQTTQGIRWLQVYTDNATVLDSGNIERLTDEVLQSDWYRKYSKTTVPYPVILSSAQTLSLVQKLDNYYSGGTTKLLKIDLNTDMIGHFFQSNTFDGKLYFVDPDGLVQYSNDPEVHWTAGSAAFADVVLPGKSLKFESSYAKVNYLNGWSLHGVMNEEIVMKEVWKSRSFVIVLACMNFVIPTIIIAAMSRSLNVRLVRILKHMKKVKNQNFQTIPHEEARDEIGQLTGEFNRMTERINSLINDVYVADIQKKDLELKQQQAQLHALHSQINPHFLFNALETIRMRSVIKGEGETARIIHTMAKIFRKSISWGRDYVTIREELELIGCFLEIQKYRFGDKLEYLLDIDEAAYDWQIPKMTFLPFVENASIHGIESIPGKGRISLRIEVRQKVLVFVLEDNGIGIAREKLVEIMNYLKRDDSMGDKVGMKNAYSRLKLCYGDAFHFSIDSTEGQGTRIEIRLPMGNEEY
jgi:two-component system, sensor histidine kinase YesM